LNPKHELARENLRAIEQGGADGPSKPQ
jgi:hypothetical protein